MISTEDDTAGGFSFDPDYEDVSTDDIEYLDEYPDEYENEEYDYDDRSTEVEDDEEIEYGYEDDEDVGFGFGRRRKRHVPHVTHERRQAHRKKREALRRVKRAGLVDDSIHFAFLSFAYHPSIRTA